MTKTPKRPARSKAQSTGLDKENTRAKPADAGTESKAALPDLDEGLGIGAVTRRAIDVVEEVGEAGGQLLHQGVEAASALAEKGARATRKAAEASAELAREGAAIGTHQAEAVGDWLGQGFHRMSATWASLQDAAREAAQSLGDSHRATGQSVAALQHKMLEMAQSNVQDSVALVQKLLKAKHVGEAIRIQGEYAQSTMKTLTDQASTIRTLSVQLAEDLREPMAKQIKRNAERFLAPLKEPGEASRAARPRGR